ncbi:hypothetical protein BT67DRAFT_261692 [Trichocladium antarcticum]|uniref:Uncharacterized protein n=1 Tax=Trichocladium antarcticum TaxID=1450529 RepID=A0AAN6UQ18_9PEZI|nr:hypothetical protein BT67DRAFT_261692 [Trichocladium antarcticum]
MAARTAAQQPPARHLDSWNLEASSPLPQRARDPGSCAPHQTHPRPALSAPGRSCGRPVTPSTATSPRQCNRPRLTSAIPFMHADRGRESNPRWRFWSVTDVPERASCFLHRLQKAGATASHPRPSRVFTGNVNSPIGTACFVGFVPSKPNAKKYGIQNSEGIL